MKAFHRILACTDFSTPGNAAIEAAIGLCKDSGTTLILVHVLDAPPPVNPMYAHYYTTGALDPAQRAQAEAEATKALLDMVPQALRSLGVQVEVRIGHGLPVDEIQRLADAEKADMLVVGTQGHTGLAALILGSVVDRIVRLAKCPVLVVR
ncbi:MAG: universal stress protein [Pseudomonadota bacterium]